MLRGIPVANGSRARFHHDRACADDGVTAYRRAVGDDDVGAEPGAVADVDALGGPALLRTGMSTRSYR